LYEHVCEAALNTRIRTFLTVVSLFFAALLAFEIGRTLLHTTERRTAADGHRVVDRPADPMPAANPPHTPGRSLIRHATHFAAKAG
jgi:hypothetical protein